MGCEGEPSAEANLQRNLAGLGLTLAQEALGCQGDGGGGGVSGLGNIAPDDDVLAQTKHLHELIDDAHGGLVRNEYVNVGELETGGCNGTARNVRGTEA